MTSAMVLLIQVSGTTATVAVFLGWDVMLASVGDSTAYLDTGAEVIQVSLNIVHALQHCCTCVRFTLIIFYSII